MKKKQKKKIKTHFNFPKFLKNMSILGIIIFLIYWIISSLFIPPKKPLPKVVATPQTKVRTNLPVEAPVNPVIAYKAKQYKILLSIFRFNENLYMAMATNNVVNLYPDSQNGVTALNDNLSTAASKLNPTDVRAESLFLSELTQKNNTYINSILAYNKAILAKSPNTKELVTLKESVQQTYNDINVFMNKNLNIFK